MVDLIVLGGGPAGYLAAERAGAAGLSTVLIEKNKIGGVCLNEGCIPSKTLLNSAKIFEHAKHGQAYGVTAENVRLDQPAVIRRKNKVVKKLVAGITATLKSGKTVIMNGTGTILGRENGVIRVGVGDEVVEGKKLLIATGSEAIVPRSPAPRKAWPTAPC
jgi:dihydrolipoamide dehydrogenase